MVKEVENIQLLQEELLKMLVEIDRVCRILGIKYTLTHGSLLGAVRHKGFIPWDDDIDVAMTRENYEKFLNLAQDILNSEYYVQTYEKDNNYIPNFAKVLNTSIPIVEKDKMHLDVKRGLHVDIFPIDRNYNNIKRLASIVGIRIVKVIKYSSDIIGIIKNSSTKLKLVFKMFCFPIGWLCGSLRLNRIETYIRKMPNNDNRNMVTFADYDPAIFDENKEMPYDIYENYIELLFEGRRFMCISDYDTYLTKHYGKYMELPPVEYRKPHHGLFVDSREKRFL